VTAQAEKVYTMRILVVSNIYPNPLEPDRGTYNRHQVRALADRHAVSVIAPVSWLAERALRGRGAAPIPRGRRVTLDGIRVEHPRYYYAPKILRGWYGPWYRRTVREAFQREVQAERPDIVLAAWAYPDGWAVTDLAQRADLPAVVKLHGSDVLGEGRGLPPRSSRRRRTAEALGRADGIVAVSRDIASCAVGLGADPHSVRVVYNGVDQRLFHPGCREGALRRLGLSTGTPLVLFVGAFVRRKAPDVLVEACAIARRQGCDFCCRLVGDGPLRSSLRRQISSSGLENRVAIAGPVRHHDLADWYRAAAVCVLPSHSEGVPNVLLEAAACGTPWIASRVGGIPEVEQLGGLELVAPGDPRALAHALCRHMTDLDLATPVPPARLRSQDDVARELTDFFAEVIDRRRAGASARRAA
jgi:glycosyltransferase involved in cell wall biosynthesis